MRLISNTRSRLLDGGNVVVKNGIWLAIPSLTGLEARLLLYNNKPSPSSNSAL